MEGIVDSLLKAMNTTLETTTWMDNETRNRAIIKLDAMGQKIGFPDDVYNETKILMPFEGVRKLI